MTRRRSGASAAPAPPPTATALHPVFAEAQAALEGRYVAVLDVAKRVTEDDVELAVDAVVVALSRRSLVATVRDGAEEGIDQVIRVILALDPSGGVLAAGPDGRLTSVQPIDQLVRGLAHVWQRPIGIGGGGIEWPASRLTERSDKSLLQAFGTGMVGESWLWWRRDPAARAIVHGLATGSGTPVSYGLVGDRAVASITTDHIVITVIDSDEHLPSGMVAVTGETLWIQVQEPGWPGPLTFSVESDPIVVAATAEADSEAARLARGLVGLDLFHGLGEPGTTVSGDRFNALVDVLVSGERRSRDERFRAIGELLGTPRALVEAAVQSGATVETLVSDLAAETGSRATRVRRIAPSSNVRAAQAASIFEQITLPSEGKGLFPSIQRWFVAGPLRQIVLGIAPLALGVVVLGRALGFFDALEGLRANPAMALLFGLPASIYGGANIVAGLTRIVRRLRGAADRQGTAPPETHSR